MKKFIAFPLLLLVGLFFNCSSDDDVVVDNDTISTTFDVTQNFTLDPNTGIYFINLSFNQPLFNSDVVLVYRQNGSFNNNPIWEQIPQTIFFNNGDELDYNFSFTINDIEITAVGTFDLAEEPNFINNQRFRIIAIPAGFASSVSASSVDFSDYNSVIEHFNLDDSQITTIQ